MYRIEHTTGMLHHRCMTRLEKLCNGLRDAENPHAVRCAAEELRAYLKEEQHITRAKLHPYIEKLFVALQVDKSATN